MPYSQPSSPTQPLSHPGEPGAFALSLKSKSGWKIRSLGMSQPFAHKSFLFTREGAGGEGKCASGGGEDTAAWGAAAVFISCVTGRKQYQHGKPGSQIGDSSSYIDKYLFIS